MLTNKRRSTMSKLLIINARQRFCAPAADAAPRRPNCLTYRYD
jgi:hypothetical protein